MEEGYVYFLHAEGTGFVKVGVSENDPMGRMRNLQTGCPYEIMPMYVVWVKNPFDWEYAVHRAWKEFKSYGEWFNMVSPHTDTIEIVRKIQAQNKDCRIFAYCSKIWSDHNPLEVT